MFENKGKLIFSFWGSVPRRVGWLWIGIRFHQKLWAVSLGKAATLSLFPPQEYLLSSCSEDEIMMFISSSLIMFISAWCLVYLWSTGGFQGGIFCPCGHGWGNVLRFEIQGDAIWIQMWNPHREEASLFTKNLWVFIREHLRGISKGISKCDWPQLRPFHLHR